MNRCRCFLGGLIMLSGCAPEAPEEDTGETGLLEMGAIDGSVVLGVEILAQQSDAMVIVAAVEENPDMLLPHRIYHVPRASEVLVDQPVNFRLDNLFPQSEPYYVLALLDRDESIRNTGEYTLTSGDLISSPALVGMTEVVVGSDEIVPLTLSLDFIAD